MRFMSRRIFSAIAVAAPVIIAKVGEAAAQSGGVIDAKLKERNIVLPKPTFVPKDVARIPIRWVIVQGDRAYVSGHVASDPEGVIGTAASGPYGKVGKEVSEKEGYDYARRVGLSILADLRRELGTLDRVERWLRVFGMVNAIDGFAKQPAVVNGFSDLILDVCGPDRGTHARSAVGLAGLPFNAPVEIEAEVLIRA